MRDIAGAFLKLGAMSYGGPAIMGIMQTEIQERRGWLTKERFLEGLSLVNMLPGPGATQLAIFIGHQLAGWRGAVLAGMSFIFPAFLIMMALAIVYGAYGALPVARHAFYGLGPVVLAIFVVAVYRLGKNALKGAQQVTIAVIAALLSALPPIGIVPTLLLAGCAGIALYHSLAAGLKAAAVMVLLIATAHWIGLLGMPIDAMTMDSTGGGASRPGFLEIAVFFFKIGAFTFGGGITVLAFVQDQVVNHLQWLTPQEFLDGLALGQFTPGPILMLAAYIGYKANGIGGAVAGATAIFLPSFIVMLSLLPILDRVRSLAWVKAAMKAIGAAVIGVLCVALTQLAPHAMTDAFTGVLFAAAVAAMLCWNAGPLKIILAGAGAGLAARLSGLHKLREFS
jgi:chromate transporter